MGDGDDQGDQELQPVARSTSRCDERDAKHALRSAPPLTKKSAGCAGSHATNILSRKLGLLPPSAASQGVQAHFHRVSAVHVINDYDPLERDPGNVPNDR